MDTNIKLIIYKDMIQYLLDSTDYSLKNIAELTGFTLENIHSIYVDQHLPINSSPSEIQFIKFFNIILEMQANKYSNLSHRSCQKREVQ
jgi:hypothetical protein